VHGEVFVWDLGARRCVHRFRDEGCVHATTLAASPDGSRIACGSDSGVVNVYAADACLRDAAPTPLRAVDNLTTAISSLSFSGDGRWLAMASRHKKDALRLVHVPSLRVCPSWPTAQTPLHRVYAVDTSPTGRMLAVGNDRGRALLYTMESA
jgi:U3 small nucleolar RNA-associated protein 18